MKITSFKRGAPVIILYSFCCFAEFEPGVKPMYKSASLGVLIFNISDYKNIKPFLLLSLLNYTA